MPDPAARKKILIGFAAAAVIPAFILLDTLIGFARGWRMTYRQEQAIVAGVALWLAAAVLLVCLPRGRAIYLQRWTRLVVLAFFLLLAALVTEVIIRSLPTGGGAFHLREPNHQWTFRPSPEVMPGISGDSHYTTNSDGVRGPQMPLDDKTIRVLCLGGSTTECLYLDDEETWTRLIAGGISEKMGGSEPRLNGPRDHEPRLNESRVLVWTGSAGASGLASDAHLQFIESSGLVPRMDAIALLVGINDLSKALLPSKSQAGGELARPELVGRPLWRRSATLIRGGVLAKQLVKKLRGDNLDIEDAGGASYVSRRERRHAATIDRAGPDFDAAVDGYRARIEKIVDACAGKGVKLVLVTQPVLWDPSLSEKQQALLWFGWLDDGRYLSVAALRAAMDRYNDALRAVARRRGVPLADLAPMNGKAEFFIDDCHFSEAGAREVSRLVAPVVAGTLRAAEPGAGK